MFTSGNFEGRVSKHMSSYAVLKKNQKIAMVRQQVRLDGGFVNDANALADCLPEFIRSADKTTWSPPDSACSVCC